MFYMVRFRKHKSTDGTQIGPSKLFVVLLSRLIDREA
jgi:hypothetical protein